MAGIRQRGFAAGEFDPYLWGRDDLKQYDHASRVVKNFVPLFHGSLLSRPGTLYVNNTKSDQAVRLIPFNYADIADQNYVLEFGNLYVRFHTSQGTVTSGGVPYEIVSPYTTADLARLKFVQVGDVLTLVHPSYAPRELRRSSHTSWAFNVIDFTNFPAQTLSDIGFVDPLPTADATHVALSWNYVVTQVVRNTALNIQYETLITDTADTVYTGPPGYTASVAYGGSVASYTDRVVKLWIGTFYPSGAPPAIVYFPNLELVGYKIYKGRNKIFGLIGYVAKADLGTYGTAFEDPGIEPDYSLAPPSGRDITVLTPDDGTGVVHDYPSNVAIFEQRMFFAGSPARPATLFGSATDEYTRFEPVKYVPLSTGSVEFELASRRREQIRSMVGLRHLVTLTNSTEWSVGGAANGDPMSPTSISAKAHSERGSSWLDPVVVGDVLIHVQPKGTVVRDFFYDWQRQAYTGTDISFFSRHFFRGHDIVSWTYAEDPHSVVWAVRDDGKLLSCTYNQETQVYAWAQHETDGTVEQVCSIPEGKEDSVYLVVLRSGKRFIERMATREILLVEDSHCLDAGVQVSRVASTTVSGLTHLNGRTVSALADGFVVTGLVVTGGSVTLPFAAAKVSVGLPYTCSWESLDVGGARERQKVVKEVLIDVVMSRGLWVGESLDDFTNWSEWSPRTAPAGFAAVPLGSTTARVTVSGRWGTGGRVALQQRAPLPCMVVAVQRELVAGGS